MKLLILFLLLAQSAHAEWRTNTITFYDNAGKTGCRICTGRWSIHNRTASGVRPKVGVTAASNQLALGTRIYIEGFGWRTIQDRLADPKSHRIDVFVETHGKAKRLGILKRQVFVERK